MILFMELEILRTLLRVSCQLNLLIEALTNTGFPGAITDIFSCEDAAQQVLMYVCPSVCGQLVILTVYNLLKHEGCPRIFKNVCIMFQNVPEYM